MFLQIRPLISFLLKTMYEIAARSIDSSYKQSTLLATLLLAYTCEPVFRSKLLGLFGLVSLFQSDVAPFRHCPMRRRRRLLI